MNLVDDITVIKASSVRSLAWHGDVLVDWVGGGAQYRLDGSTSRAVVNYTYRFDAVMTSPSGRFVAIYERRGTKGLLLDRGKVRREINRSYYHADAYEFPICLFALDDGREAIAHCPEQYNRLEIDIIETGERLTQHPERKPDDCFHSRLSVSPDGQWLMSTGWCWHPWDIVAVYRIADVLADARLFDNSRTPIGQRSEVSSASFMDSSHVLLASSPDLDDDEEEEERLWLKPGSIGVYSLTQERLLSSVAAEEFVGSMMPLGDHVIGFYEHPKLIEIATGKVVKRWPDLHSGKQASSIIHHIGAIPPLAMDVPNRRFALANEDSITVVQFHDIVTTQECTS